MTYSSECYDLEHDTCDLEECECDCHGFDDEGGDEEEELEDDEEVGDDEDDDDVDCDEDEV